MPESRCWRRMCGARAGSAAPSCTPTTTSGGSPRSTTSPIACGSSSTADGRSGRIACAGWSYGGYLTLAALTFHPDLFAAGVSICGMSDLNTFYRNTEPWIAAAALPEVRSSCCRSRSARATFAVTRVDALTAPLLLAHGGNDTNVPVSESEQIGAGVAGARPYRAVPVVPRRRPRDRQTGEPRCAGRHGTGLADMGIRRPTVTNP